MTFSQPSNALPEPEHCDVCCSLNIVFAGNEIMFGQPYGKWPFCWFCKDCRAAVGCHSNTRTPLGRMADRATRTLRNQAHAEFDKLWRDGLMTRSQAYQWLARELQIEDEQCHISWLSKDQLKDVATLSANYFVEFAAILIRRREKKDARESKKLERNDRRKPSDASYIRKRNRR